MLVNFKRSWRRCTGCQTPSLNAGGSILAQQKFDFSRLILTFYFFLISLCYFLPFSQVCLQSAPLLQCNTLAVIISFYLAQMVSSFWLGHRTNQGFENCQSARLE